MWKETQIRLRFCILPLIFLLISVYFTYHLIKGERGIFRLFEVNQELTQAQALLKETNMRKEKLETKVRLLSSKQLNADMLDTVVRQQLGFIEKDEYVIFN